MSTHYALAEFRGDYDLNLVTDAGMRIRTDGVLYDGELAETILAFLELHHIRQSIEYNTYIAFRRNIGDPINGARDGFY